VERDVARALEAIAAEGSAAFYGGEAAARLAERHRRDGGHLDRDDLAGQASSFDEPLAVTYRGRTVLDQPPVSLGAVFLEELKIVEGFDLASLPVESAERAHLLIEAKKLAFADMEDYLTDPDHAPRPATDFLTDAHAAERRSRIDPDRAAAGAEPAAVASGDHTTYLAVVDRDGNAVSWIQSIFQRFGSAWVADGTGVLLNDRMNGFSVDRAHVNCVAGGKRTAHTLNAPMVLRHR